MADFLNTIDLLGDETVAKLIVERGITEFKDDVLVDIAQYAFCNASNLETIDLPNVESIGEAAFKSCSKLTNVSTPNAITIGRYSFQHCSKLTNVSIPNARTLDQSAFYGCKTLQILDLPNASQMNQMAIAECKVFTTLILRRSAVCAIQYSNMFSGCPNVITVYVPYDLIDAYENATNWSSLVANGKVTFEAIEGSEYE
jgi:hypothetical protein